MAETLQAGRRDWATEAIAELTSRIATRTGVLLSSDEQAQFAGFVRRHASRAASKSVHPGMFGAVVTEPSKVAMTPRDVFQPVWMKHRADFSQMGTLLDSGDGPNRSFWDTENAETHFVGAMIRMLNRRGFGITVSPRGIHSELLGTGPKRHFLKSDSLIELLAEACMSLDALPQTNQSEVRSGNWSPAHDPAAAAGEEIDRLISEELVQRHGPGAYRPGKLGIAAIIRKHLEPTQPVEA